MYSSHQCYCRNGFTGYSCQINWDECRSNPCLNGGSCVDGIASFNCSCPENFAGVFCEVDLSICEEAFPCQNNGTCTLDTRNVTGTGFICSCPPGFTGHQCEIDISVCNTTENVCQNGGKCVDGIGNRFYCECEPGWSGETCHIDVDECESQPCLNGGICVNKINDFSCACPFGFTGRACETKLRICEENPCLNGAFCLNEQDDESKKTCYCVPDFHGELCEFRYDDCDPLPKCFNGGTCIDGVGEFSCSCPPDFFGPTCQCTAENVTEPECAYNGTSWPTFSETAVLPSILATTQMFPPLTQIASQTQIYRSSETPLESTDIVKDTMTAVQSMPEFPTTTVFIPSPSPYDPGGGASSDVLQTSVIMIPETSIVVSMADDSSLIIRPPQETMSVWPAETITFPPSHSIPGPAPSESNGVYEPSPTIRLDGSEVSLVSETSPVVSPTMPLQSTPILATPALSSEPISETPRDDLTPESTIISSPQLSSLSPDPQIIEVSSEIGISRDTVKVDPNATPFISSAIDLPPSSVPPLSGMVSSIVEVPSGSITYPHGLHTADLTADLPYDDLSSTLIVVDVVVVETELVSSPLPPQPITPHETQIMTAILPEPPVSMPEPTQTLQVVTTPVLSLLPSPSETVFDSEEISTTLFMSPFVTIFPQSPPPLSELSSPPSTAVSDKDSSYSEGIVVQPTPFPATESIMESTLGVSPTVIRPESTFVAVMSTAIPTPDYDSVTVSPEPSTTALVSITPTPQLPPPTTTTTPQPNLTDLCTNYCHNNAKCIADSIEPICLCSFKFTGNQCEVPKEKFRAASFMGDSFLSFRVSNESIISKIDIRTKLVTIVPEGVLLYTGVGRMYALIFIQNGHVTLHFSCGSQSMHFVETRTRVDNGFNFTLEFRMEMIVQGVNEVRCSAEVSVNQSYVMKGEQIVGHDGVILSTHPIETVYLGGVAPFNSDAALNDDLVGILPGFRGCLHNLMINQETKDIYDDALDGKEVAECTSFGCVANPCHGSARCTTTHHYPFWECICPRGYKGHRCQIIECSSNPCQNGATCTYSQDSLNLMFNSTAGEDSTDLVSTTLSPLVYEKLQPICLCPLGFSGLVCQHKLNVSKPAFQPISGYSSFVAYDPIPRFVDWFQLKFHFVTKNISQISLLLYSGNNRGPQPLHYNNHHHSHHSLITTTVSSIADENNNHMGFDQSVADARPEPVSDFFAVTFLQGFVALTWNLGSGTQRITTPSRVDNRLNIHTLFAGRSGRQAWLKVDGMRNVTGKTPGPLYRLNSDSNELYIGGYKSYKFEGLSHDLPLHQGFQGCIFDLGFRVKNRLYLPRPIRGRNVKNCFEEDC
ncbi:Protein eyes shut [Orchesella cincta]|uniref:Protein eyes shut n=1 Tax=Orchesella cincta TaxID=48709 RepID=A0A1D2NCL0_ORCCI|nr:Protein eyes shut [Orchesella cincta]